MDRVSAYSLFEERVAGLRGNTERIIHGAKWVREPDAYQVEATSKRVVLKAYWLDNSSPFPGWDKADVVELEEVLCVTSAG